MLLHNAWTRTSTAVGIDDVSVYVVSVLFFVVVSELPRSQTLTSEAGAEKVQESRAKGT